MSASELPPVHCFTHLKSVRLPLDDWILILLIFVLLPVNPPLLLWDVCARSTHVHQSVARCHVACSTVFIKASTAPSFQMGSGWNLAGLFFKWMNTHGLTESDLRFDVTPSRCRAWRHLTQISAVICREHLCSDASCVAPGSSVDSSWILIHSYLFYTEIFFIGFTGLQHRVSCIRRAHCVAANYCVHSAYGRS